MSLEVKENVPLKNHSTMKLGGNARYLVKIKDEHELVEAINFARGKSLPFKVIGSGSNIIWADNGFEGLVVVNRILGFKLTSTEDGAILEVGAGEDWDSVVARAVEKNLSGIEELSLVPGQAGATPIQNVGAYGREIKDILISVRAYDTKSNKIIEIPGSECQFAYRDSRFKSADKGRFLITSIKLKLSKAAPKPPFYAQVQDYFDAHAIKNYSPQATREAVIAIRSAKLPDPAKNPNSGSFFKNPVVEKALADELIQKHPELQHWPQPDGRVKLSAAWLIEMAGLKDYHDPKTGIATWPTQSLTFVNENAHSTADLLAFREMVVSKVKEKFGITLEQEPELA